MFFCFLVFFKGGDFILKFKNFKDINSVYKIIDITDEYIISKLNDKILRVYIYEIEPISIINISEDIQKNIQNSYVTFLREINIEFQILLINKIVNLDSMINKKEENDFEIMYLNEVKDKLKNEEFSYTKYYIVVSLKKQDKIEDVDKIISILKNCGCVSSRLSNKKDIEKVMYECINKVTL